LNFNRLHNLNNGELGLDCLQNRQKPLNLDSRYRKMRLVFVQLRKLLSEVVDWGQKVGRNSLTTIFARFFTNPIYPFHQRDLNYQRSTFAFPNAKGEAILDDCFGRAFFI
jgi:hypothetical protein